MSFALTVQELMDELMNPGCPICGLSQKKALLWIDSVLWEYVNDPGFRETIERSHGFCPAHTLLFFSPELKERSVVLGLNIIYEYLGWVVCKELRNIQKGGRTDNGIKRWLMRWKRSKIDESQSTEKLCPICEITRVTSKHALATLFEELEYRSEGIWQEYKNSDGLCLNHLQKGMAYFSTQHPSATSLLVNEAVIRLEKQSDLMAEYIRKNNWEYHDEKISPAENAAWRKSLTFFTGFPKSKFV